ERVQARAEALDQLAQRALVVSGTWRPRVERVQRGARLLQVVRLDERHPRALHRVGHDQLRPCLARERLQSARERLDVVAVAARDRPAERADLALEVTQVADALDPGVGLDLVVVDDRRDLAEALVDGLAERLPELAFLQ